jgi:hypothetical protein
VSVIKHEHDVSRRMAITDHHAVTTEELEEIIDEQIF